MTTKAANMNSQRDTVAMETTNLVNLPCMVVYGVDCAINSDVAFFLEIGHDIDDDLFWVLKTSDCAIEGSFLIAVIYTVEIGPI
jgi:hypothetical protein